MLAPDTVDALRQQVAGELAQGPLRRAQQLAAGLPADDPVRDRITAADARVTALARRADTEETRGLAECAAARLADAIRLARDDTGLSERLAAASPSPPEQVSARMDGDHVLVTWNPSRAVTGRVQYLVRRGLERAPGLPSEGVAVVLRTERTDVTDAEAPAGSRAPLQRLRLTRRGNMVRACRRRVGYLHPGCDRSVGRHGRGVGRGLLATPSRCRRRPGGATRGRPAAGT